MGPDTPDPAAGGEAASPLVRLRQLGPQWAAASGAAFAGMAQSPERYAAASRLVAAWLDRLRSLATEADGVAGADGAAGVGEPGSGRDEDEGAQAAAAALLDAWERRESGTGDPVADGSALPLTGAERESLAMAAFAIRYGEVTAWAAARRRQRAMARERGRTGRDPGGWLVLDEAGDPAGDPFVAYRRLEVDPVSGAGVLVETRPDESFTGVVHGVQLVSVDPANGELTADNDGKYWEFSSARDREEHVAALRDGHGRAPGVSAP
jgi:hypothetical protein